MCLDLKMFFGFEFLLLLGWYVEWSISEIPAYQVLEGFYAIRNLLHWFYIRNPWPLYSLKMFPIFVSLLFKESLALIS